MHFPRNECSYWQRKIVYYLFKQEERNGGGDYFSHVKWIWLEFLLSLKECNQYFEKLFFVFTQVSNI